MSAIATITLSQLPPSMNNLFATIGRKRVRSARYRAWLESAGWELAAQKPGTVAGPYAVTMTFGRKDKRRRDIGNLEKPCSDLLVAHRVVEDDSLAQRIHLEWGNVEGVVIQVCSTKERP